MTEEGSTMNVEVLRKLLIWAAEDYVLDNEPDLAREVGLVRNGVIMSESQGDKTLLGRWRQNSWGDAFDGYEAPGVNTPDEASTPEMCGTAFCMAGGAVMLSDKYTPVMEGSAADGFSMESVVVTSDIARFNAPIEPHAQMLWVNGDDEEDVLSDLSLVYISTAGREVLGLSFEQAGLFFNGDNTLDQLVSYAETWAEAENKQLNLPSWIISKFMDEDHAEIARNYV